MAATRNNVSQLSLILFLKQNEKKNTINICTSLFNFKKDENKGTICVVAFVAFVFVVLNEREQTVVVFKKKEEKIEKNW